jgi:hypothetical protein
MYNYFIEEKRKKDAKSIISEKRKDEKIKEKRKTDREHLVASYERRLKNFVYNMASDPILIKEYKSTIQTSRKQLFDEEADKILGRHGFILKGYKTDKERINDYLRERNDGAVSPNETKHSFNLIRKTTLIQPTMRFKPRSDIERIFDINNERDIGRIDRKIIDRHLHALGLNYGKNVYSEEEDLQALIQNNKEHELEKMKKKNEKIRKDRKDAFMIRDKRFKLGEANNFLIDTKHIMADLHHKTFFKGATSFTLAEGKSTLNLIKETTTERNATKPNGRSMSNAEPKNVMKTLIDSDIKSEVAHINPLLYNINLNPYKKREDEFDKNAISQLKELAFRKEKPVELPTKKKTNFFDKIKTGDRSSNIEEPLLKNNPTNFFRKYSENSDFIIKKPDDDKVRVDGKEFNRDDINSITKVVLRQCNFFHNKNKNNTNSLKVGTGKLMQTNGLSIAEFGKKYHISGFNSLNNSKY